MALSCEASVVKFLLFFFNFLVWLTGVFLLANGIWILADGSSFMHHMNLTGGSLHSAGVALCVLGGLIFIVAGMGCWGACMESMTCLMMFACMIGFLIVAQFLTVVGAGVLYNKAWDIVGSFMNKTMVEDYAQYGHYGNGSVTEAFNFIQMTSRCCGAQKGPEDWKNTNWYTHNSTRNGTHNATVPDSCCTDLVNPEDYNNPEAKNESLCYEAAINTAMRDRDQYVHVKGCQNVVEDIYHKIARAMIIVSVVVLLIQVVILIMACCLRSSIKKSFPRSGYTSIGYV